MTPKEAVNMTVAQLQQAMPNFNWQAIIQAILSALSGNCFSPTPTPAALRATAANPTPWDVIMCDRYLARAGIALHDREQVRTTAFHLCTTAPDAQLAGLMAAAQMHKAVMTEEQP